MSSFILASEPMDVPFLYASLSLLALAFAPLYRLSRTRTWTTCVLRSANVLGRNFLRSFTPSCGLTKAALP